MPEFTIFPAIDLKGGRCVRLLQGRAEDETVYSDDPVAMALHWQEQGGRYLHVVDLDGAFRGRPVHTDVIRRITEALDIPVEVGGGLRRDDDVAQILEAGAARAIIGTRACRDPESLSRLVQRFGDAIAVGIDARDGQVQVEGWTETTGSDAVELARSMAQLGVSTLIYTDTSRDGMLQGVHAAALDALCAAVPCGVIASGGVSSAQDIQTLRDLQRPNLLGAIVGKALYEKRVTLPELAL